MASVMARIQKRRAAFAKVRVCEEQLRLARLARDREVYREIEAGGHGSKARIAQEEGTQSHVVTRFWASGKQQVER